MVELADTRDLEINFIHNLSALIRNFRSRISLIKQVITNCKKVSVCVRSRVMIIEAVFRNLINLHGSLTCGDIGFGDGELN